MTTVNHFARRLVPFVAGLLVAWLSACSMAGPPGARSALIPRDELFGGVDRASGTLSPDGRWLAYLAANGTALSIWIAPVDQPTRGRAVLTSAKDTPFRLQFSSTGSHLLYRLDGRRDENVQIFALNLASGRSVALSPRGVKAEVARLSVQLPGEALLSMNDRDHRQFDLVRVNLDTGAGRRVMENAGQGATVVDDQFNPRYAVEQTEDGGHRWQVREGQDWKPWSEIPQPDALTSALLDLSADGSTLYLRDSRGRNTAALYALDVRSGERRLLHADDTADVEAVLRHPATGLAQAVAVDALRRRWVALDPGLAPDLARLERLAGGGDFSIRDRSRDDRIWVVAIDQAGASTKVHLYHRTSGELKLWYDTQPFLAQYDHFLRRCLGGEALAIERDFWDSSLTLPVGAGLLPAVKAAYTTAR